MSDIIPRPFPDLDLPLRCFIGMSEDVSEVGESEIAHTVLGKTILLPSPWSLKFSFRLACSGPLVMPLPDDVFRKGARVRYDSSVWRTVLVPAGLNVIKVTRPVAAATAVSADDGRNLRPLALGDEIYFTPAFEGFALVRYRLRHECLVSVPPTISTQVTGRDTSWSLDLVEEYAS